MIVNLGELGQNEGTKDRIRFSLLRKLTVRRLLSGVEIAASSKREEGKMQFRRGASCNRQTPLKGLVIGEDRGSLALVA